MTGISAMLNFLALLKNNNNRPWFAEHKADYEKIRMDCFREIEELIDHVARFDSRVAGLTPQEATYRIYRDIRFSNDKSPFKTHFGIVIASHGRKTKGAGYYLHIEPGECALYGGVWFPQSDVLRVLRRSVYDNMDELQEIISRPEFRKVFPQLEGDRLKTMPRGYPADAPHAELLKLKEYLVSCRYDDRLFERPDWQDTVAGHIRLLQPFTEFFNFTFDEMHS